MTEIIVVLANGRQISFTVQEGGDGPPCFLLGMRKCGSTITNNICRALASNDGRCFVDIGHTFFGNNVLARQWQRDPALRQIIRAGVIYGGFRDAPLGLFDDPGFAAAPKLLMIRDPRDALVSEFYSNAYSHPVPTKTGGFSDMEKLILGERERARSEGIERHVERRADSLANAMNLYAPVLSMPNTIVVRYEDVILRKAELIAILARHFRLRVDERLTAAILGWADVLPVEEDPRAFVRQVQPGDHVRKLRPATIAKLNSALGETMRLFNLKA